jgi:hypothetical protein
MKVIELLNKIANGEEVPEKIKKTWVYEWNYDDIREKFTYMQEDGTRFDEDWLIENILNEKIEIIEENAKEPQEHKIPEKFKVHSWGDKDKYGSYVDSPFPTNEELMNKINEILDYLEEIK